MGVTTMLVLACLASVAADVLHVSHVPKTGGTVLTKSLKHCGYKVHSREMRLAGQPRTTLLRNPFEHVPSMYAHCRAARYSPHAKTPRGDNVTHGFDMWLDAALRGNSADRHIADCYNPNNFMVRFYGGTLDAAMRYLDDTVVGLTVEALLAYYNCPVREFSHGSWPRISTLTEGQRKKIVELAALDLALYAYAGGIAVTNNTES